MKSFKEKLSTLRVPVASNENSSIDEYWKNMFKFLKGRKFYLNPDVLEYTCEFLLDSLLQGGSNDFQDIMKVLVLYIRYTEAKPLQVRTKKTLKAISSCLEVNESNLREQFERCIPNITEWRYHIDEPKLFIALVKYNIFSLKAHPQSSRFTRFMFSQTWFEQGVDSMHDFCASLKKQVLLMQQESEATSVCALLKRGVNFTHIRPEELECFHERTLHRDLQLLKSANDFMIQGEDRDHAERLRIETELLLDRVPVPSVSKAERWESVRRIFLVLRVLNAVIDSDPSCVADIVQSIKLYFRIIPDPLVSIEEIAGFVYSEVWNDARVHQIVDTITGNFRALFYPEYAVSYGPRSLKHLCRCSVRNSLNGGILPNIIKDLEIPLNLKQLLLGARE